MPKSTKNVVIRADSSSEIGTGHIFRCLSLAEALKKKGFQVVFCSKNSRGNINSRVFSQGYPVFEVPENDYPLDYVDRFRGFDWLIVDHYQLSAPWESLWRPFVDKIMVIDDLANRSHDCDLLLDQNYYQDGYCRYKGLVPLSAQVLIGPQYALLREEFAQIAASMPEKTGNINRLMVSFGGSDPHNTTIKVLEALSRVDMKHVEVEVIVGSSCLSADAVSRKAETLGYEFFQNVDNMAERMAQVDLFIGAGGTTTWERMALGLPGIVISVADNQREISEQLAEGEYHLYLGPQELLSSERLIDSLKKFMGDPNRLASYARKGKELVDGYGVERIVNFLFPGC